MGRICGRSAIPSLVLGLEMFPQGRRQLLLDQREWNPRSTELTGGVGVAIRPSEELSHGDSLLLRRRLRRFWKVLTLCM